MDGLLIVPIVLPVLAGALLVILAFREQLAEVRNVGSGKKESKKGPRSDSVIKNTCCFSRGPELPAPMSGNSQPPKIPAAGSLYDTLWPL